MGSLLTESVLYMYITCLMHDDVMHTYVCVYMYNYVYTIYWEIFEVK